MDIIVVYSANRSPRLTYVLDWLMKERLHTGCVIVHDISQTEGLPFFISYGAVLPGAMCIPAHGLLWELGKEPPEIRTGKWHSLPTIFATDEPNYTLPFDLFSAIFFLITRYEEYYAYKPDKHGRYPATESILHKNHWLQRPQADEWIHALRNQIRPLAEIPLPAPAFLYQPTYDIDMAYSHLHKGARRIVGAYIRALLKGDVKQISERTQVLKNKQKDPYDSFRWLKQLHKQYDYKPLYFILSALKTTAYDKNIHPEHPAMMRVIRQLVKEGSIGIHPSYYSGEEGKVAEEKKLLEHISAQHITISRQHYMRLHTPDTYRLLLQNNVQHDYSMGYGSHLGFRAGTGCSFLWYDLEQEATTTLRIHPFCFMDTTAHFEMGISASEAFILLGKMSATLHHTGSTLITIFHNFSLGTGTEWKGWRQAYEDFVQEQAGIMAAVVVSH